MQATLREDANERSVSITAGFVQLEGILIVPAEAEDIVLVAHGGGSSLYSTRNHYLTHALREVDLVTTLNQPGVQALFNSNCSLIPTTK